MIAIGIPEDSVQCRRNADQADQRSDGAGTGSVRLAPRAIRRCPSLNNLRVLTDLHRMIQAVTKGAEDWTRKLN
jgi:hypothetical protein